MMEKDTSNRFFDIQSTPEKEQARQVVNLAFGQMCKQAAIETVKGNLVYGKFKGFHIPHITRKIPSFGRFDVVVGGHRSALNAIQANHGPSWRMIVDLGDEVKGYGVFPGGQSGNPGSRFYDNMVSTWAEGAYNNLLFLKNSDPASAGNRLLTKQTFLAY
jgi:penicillin G amidase